MNEALAALGGDFSALYSRMGRPSIPPEKLLRAMLLQAFYSIRSERQLMERLEFDLLFRWFVGIGVDDAAWDHSTFSKNRQLSGLCLVPCSPRIPGSGRRERSRLRQTCVLRV
jgi:transposase